MRYKQTYADAVVWAVVLSIVILFAGMGFAACSNKSVKESPSSTGTDYVVVRYGDKGKVAQCLEFSSSDAYSSHSLVTITSTSGLGGGEITFAGSFAVASVSPLFKNWDEQEVRLGASPKKCMRMW